MLAESRGEHVSANPQYPGYRMMIIHGRCIIVTSVSAVVVAETAAAQAFIQGR
ncbi:hypothetical protein OE88DRAFT_1656855 [Heliocybe sulcata]|uniref:Uncharacterized protein n=1 Tax=Heliocybe sulcata TaxID=5364 RepID=A0A5C3N6N2_9AGAM|nr:hypothetical protein OE88DRAFT_1656855 [Heliocybe sulcata]